MKYYKFLTEDNRGVYSYFDFTPYLPNGDEPGDWLPEVERLELCESGYHACKVEDLQHWFNAQLFEIEYKQEPEHADDKVNGYCIRFVRKVDTWNDKTARLFAVWCAREALKLVDNPDERSINACDVAERYANGEATKEELHAARHAAGSAARHAAGNASWHAAWNAAWAASGHAAWNASWAALGSAQSKKLIEMLGI